MPETTAANPMVGSLIFALGGLAGAVFAVPFRKVKGWAYSRRRSRSPRCRISAA